MPPLKPLDQDLLTMALRGDDSQQKQNNHISHGKNHSTDLVQEILEHHKQRRRHKTVLFYGVCIISLALWGTFVFCVACTDRLLNMLYLTPFALVPVSLLGIIPTAGMLVMFKCIFRPPGNFIDSPASDIVKTVVEGAKSINN